MFIAFWRIRGKILLFQMYRNKKYFANSEDSIAFRDHGTFNKNFVINKTNSFWLQTHRKKLQQFDSSLQKSWFKSPKCGRERSKCCSFFWVNCYFRKILLKMFFLSIRVCQFLKFLHEFSRKPTHIHIHGLWTQPYSTRMQKRADNYNKNKLSYLSRTDFSANRNKWRNSKVWKKIRIWKWPIPMLFHYPEGVRISNVC